MKPYETNGHRLFHADCLEFLKTLPENHIDLVLTDPPYQVDNTRTGEGNQLGNSLQPMMDSLAENKIIDGFNEKILDELMRVCRGVNMYLFCNRPQLPMYMKYFVIDRGCKFELIKWHKTNTPPTYSNKYLTDCEYAFYAYDVARCFPQNYEDASTVYTSPINKQDKKAWEHPTIKPLDLVSRLVRNSSREGDTVLDCFMGTATTGVACQDNGREFIGCDINEYWYNMACERMQKHCAQQVLF